MERTCGWGPCLKEWLLQSAYENTTTATALSPDDSVQGNQDAGDGRQKYASALRNAAGQINPTQCNGLGGCGAVVRLTRGNNTF